MPEDNSKEGQTRSRVTSAFPSAASHSSSWLSWSAFSLPSASING